MPNILDQLARRAGDSPQATALRSPTARISYGSLWHRAGLVAQALADQGVRGCDIVAISMPSGPETVVAMLGVWRAGAAFLPIDTATPDERRRYLLDHSRAAAILGPGSADPVRLAPAGGHAGQSGAAPAGADDAPAYVIYTSGSTGTPKGVLVGHAAIAGHTAAVTDYLGLTERDTVLQFASIGFDVAQEEIWPTLTAGGTLAFHTDTLPDARQLAATVHALDVSVLQLPTAYWRALTRELDGAAEPRFAGVRTVVIGGENATAAEARTRLRTPLSHAALVNGYGPTETVVTATVHRLSQDDGRDDGQDGGQDDGRDDARPTGGLPIGGPLGERLLYLLDDERRPVAPGEEGELWIGGPLLAAGYLHDPDRTRERFRPDPFAQAPGARMYRTGDLVKAGPDGALVFLGRVDNQVKVRGHRIELDEVDTHLRDVPGVRDAISFTVDDGAGGARLAAAVCVGQGGPEPVEIRRVLQQRLPAYLVPTLVVPLPELPLTTSGKLDRRAAAALAAPSAPVAPAPGPRGPGRRTGRPGTSPLEVVVDLVRELLRAPAAGPDDDLFALGGDSLVVMRITAQARLDGVRLRPADLLRGRTPRAAVDLAQARADERPEHAAEPDGPLPPLPAQLRWFNDGELPERDHFCLNALFTVPAGLPAERVTAAAEALLRQHAVLRTALSTGPDGSVRAELVPVAAADAVTVRRARAQDVEDELAAAQTAMDLAAGRVFRLLHLDLGDEPGRLLLTVHHAVLDGVSMGVLTEDLETAVGGRDLPERTASVREAGAALRSWLDGAQARGDAARWLERTRDFARLSPTRTGPALLPSLRTHRFQLDEAATRTATTELPRLGVQPSDLVLACLAGGLARWTGAPRHAVDVYAHSRDVSVGELDVTRTVGYLQSTFPAVLAWEGSGLAALRRALAGPRELPERRYGFDALRFLSPDPRQRSALAACPRPQLRLNFRGHLLRMEQQAQQGLLGPAAESFGAHRSPAQSERYLLMAEGDIVDGRLEVGLRYSTDHWAPEDVAALAEAIAAVLREVLDDLPDRSPAPDAADPAPNRPETALEGALR